MPQRVLPIFPADSTHLTDLMSVSRRDDRVYYFHGLLPVFSHDSNDVKCFRMYTSQLVVNGQCKQVDIIRVFGVSAISVKRSVKLLREQGPEAFFVKRSGRGKKIWTPTRLNQAQELLNNGQTKKEVSEHLKIKLDTVYRAIKSDQLHESKKNIRQPEASEA